MANYAVVSGSWPDEREGAGSGREIGVARWLRATPQSWGHHRPQLVHS